MSLEAGILYGDIHEPFSDAKACALAEKISVIIDPAFVAVMGDTVDCCSISDHAKDPRRVRHIREEAEAGIARLRKIKAAATHAKRLVYLEGNHEYRLTRYLQKRAPELDGCVTIKELLQLDKLGFEFVPYRSHTKWGKLHLTHECGNAGPLAHAKAMDAFQSNVAIGHTHQMAIQYGGSVKGETHVGAMLGWLGSAKEIDYMHRVNMRRWQHGIGIGYKEPNGNVHLQLVPFVNGHAVVNGQLVRL